MSEQRHDKANVQVQGTNSRRRFIKKASVGAALTALPAKSVWATGGNLVNSIQASAHASGWSQGEIALLSMGFWGRKPQYRSDAQSVTFLEAFPNAYVINKDGERLYSSGSFEYKTLPGSQNDWEPITLQEATLWHIIRGVSNLENVYAQISAMYLNALFNGSHGLIFPVWNSETGRPFASLSAYAEWLFNNADYDYIDGNGQASDPTAFGSALSGLISDNHA